MNDPRLPALSITPRLLHDEVAERLRELIVRGELPPGARLNERLICERFGISRTPLREALKRLASQGLVELLPNRGAIVAPLDVAKIRDMLEVMGVLEAQAAEQACRNATDEDLSALRARHEEMLRCFRRRDLAAYFAANQRIHLQLVELSGNRTLAEIYATLNANVQRVRYQANLSRARWQAAMAEHEQLMQALERRDARKARAIVRDHLAAKVAVVLEALAGAQRAHAA